ncbi:MAG: OmpH family outer membrane protein [Pyrinomonadaceae bacterium]
MKRFSLLVVSFVFALFLVGAAFGQGAPAAQPGTNLKIVVINTAAFDAKDGITKYINAYSALEKEFTPAQNELNTLVANYQKMGADIKVQQDNLNSGKGVPVDRNALAAKIQEYQTLELTIKRKQEDGKRKFELRQSQVMTPILRDIGQAIDAYAKQKGYSLILDAAKLEGAGLLLAVDVSKLDVTKDFIAYYNTRPAGTATTAAPK